MTLHDTERWFGGLALAGCLVAAAWLSGAGQGGAQDVAQVPADADAATADHEKAIRSLIERYFVTWSAQDIDRYGQCFMPQAAIQLVNKEGGLVTMPLRQFLNTQRKAHEESAERMKETPESVEVRFEANLARVIVFWKLTVGEREETGYDHFTLMQSGGQWRIANLIFYESPKLGP